MYSPSLASCDFWVFGALKWEFCNKHLKSNVELMTTINRFFQDPLEEFYKTLTAKWNERILVWIANDNGYFEKDIVYRDDDDDDDDGE